MTCPSHRVQTSLIGNLPPRPTHGKPYHQAREPGATRVAIRSQASGMLSRISVASDAAMTTPSLTRRDFLQLSAGSLGALSAAPAAAQPEENSPAIVLDPAFASSSPVTLAVQELRQALAGRGIALRQAQ